MAFGPFLQPFYQPTIQLPNENLVIFLSPIRLIMLIGRQSDSVMRLEGQEEPGSPTDLANSTPAPVKRFRRLRGRRLTGSPSRRRCWLHLQQSRVFLFRPFCSTWPVSALLSFLPSLVHVPGERICNWVCGAKLGLIKYWSGHRPLRNQFSLRWKDCPPTSFHPCRKRGQKKPVGLH